MKKIYLFVLPVLVLCAGCRTPEYYQDQAVQKARAFLLKKSPQLSYEESSYIRFNKPVIVHSNVIGGTDSLEASNITSDMNQIQIIWQIPGQKNFYSVWGACSSAMRDYNPERIFVRSFAPEDSNRLNAVKRARAYIIGNLFSTLSVENYNDLRFRDPEISYSKFVLDKDIMPAKDEFQFSFVWQLKTKPGQKLVVIGNGRKNLANFKPVSGSELPAAETEANLLEKYKTLTAEDLRKADAEAAKKAAEAKAKADARKAVEALPPPPEQTINAEETEKINETEKKLSKEKKETPKKSSAKVINDKKIIDELPEPPELDTENDLKEPEK